MRGRTAETPFLTTSWRNLVMVNYEISPEVLQPWVPRGTELDLYEGACLVSLVGFLFEDSRLWGRWPSPWHASFEEVNLRFYVIRRETGEIRRGVVFIKELAPSRIVTWIARRWFQENYHRLAMRRIVEWCDDAWPEQGGRFGYEWQCGGRWSQLAAITAGELALPRTGSLEEFIVEHYWGYSAQRDGTTLEYRVEHRPWQVWPTSECRFDTDIERLYGREFVEPLSRTPHSALVADGSAVAVYRGMRLDDARRSTIGPIKRPISLDRRQSSEDFPPGRAMVG